MKQKAPQSRGSLQREMPSEQERQVWHDRRRAYVEHQVAQRSLRQQQAAARRKDVLGWTLTSLCGLSFATAAAWPAQPHWFMLALPVVIWAMLYVLLRWLLPPSLCVCESCLASMDRRSVYCPRCGRRRSKDLPRPWTTKHVLGLSLGLLVTTVIGTVALALGREVGWDAADQPALFWSSVILTFMVTGMVIRLKHWCDI